MCITSQKPKSMGLEVCNNDYINYQLFTEHSVESSSRKFISSSNIISLSLFHDCPHHSNNTIVKKWLNDIKKSVCSK